MAIRSLNEKDREYDDSLPMLFLKQVKSKEILEEYMRLFYVAVTRAKNRLYLTATASDGFAEKYIKNPKSMWAWLNNVAYTDEKFKEQYAVSVESAEQEELEEATSVYTYRRPSEQALKQLTDYFDKPYAYAEATVTPVKYTVTALNNIAYESKTEKKDKEKRYHNIVFRTGRRLGRTGPGVQPLLRRGRGRLALVRLAGENRQVRGALRRGQLLRGPRRETHPADLCGLPA